MSANGLQENDNDDKVPTLSAEQARAALQEILTSFKTGENVTKLDEARDNAGNDMLKMMQMVFPVATQIQAEIIPKFGFSNDGEGLIKFAQTICALEKENSDIAQLHKEMKSTYMPQMDLSFLLPSGSQSANSASPANEGTTT